VLIHGDMWQEAPSHSVLRSVSTRALHRGLCSIVGYVIYDVDRHAFNGICYGCTCFILNY
jgi:hypothetical protein